MFLPISIEKISFTSFNLLIIEDNTGFDIESVSYYSSQDHIFNLLNSSLSNSNIKDIVVDPTIHISFTLENYEIVKDYIKTKDQTVKEVKSLLQEVEDFQSIYNRAYKLSIYDIDNLKRIVVNKAKDIDKRLFCLSSSYYYE